MTLIGLLLLLLALGWMAHQAVNVIVWLTVPPLLLVFLQWQQMLPVFLALSFWLLYATALFFYLAPGLRRRWLTRPLLSPSLSRYPILSLDNSTLRIPCLRYGTTVCDLRCDNSLLCLARIPWQFQGPQQYLL